MRYVIYKLELTTTGDAYIGYTTTRRLRARRNEHMSRLRTKKHPCLALQDAWNRSDPSLWTYTTMGYADDRYSIDLMERYAVTVWGTLNSYLGGMQPVHTNPVRLERSISTRINKVAPCTFQHESGIHITTNHLSAFAREHNLRVTAIYGLRDGSLKSHAGWSICPSS